MPPAVFELRAEIARKLRWEPVEDLLRLNGFEEDWELTVLDGKACPGDRSLEACGIRSGSRVVTVRKVLFADGWKINADVDDVDSSDEEDEF